MGETTLIKMHKGYTVDGADKQVAYEVAVGEGPSKKPGMIYVTHKLEHQGLEYFRDKEGYSILVILADRSGKELCGAYVPLQSIPQKGDQYLYTTGTKDGPGAFAFPPDPLKPAVALQAAYHSSFVKERDGEAAFQVWRPDEAFDHRAEPMTQGRARLGEKIRAGVYYLSVKEVRYWVGMNVRYDPGKPIVLANLWAGLSGMVLTFIARMRSSKRRFLEQPIFTEVTL